MATQQSSERGAWLRRTASQLWRDYVYIVPGVFISLFAFVVLVTLFTAGVSTLVVWVGVLILPLALTIAGAFADLSRVRLRLLGIDFEPVAYRPRNPGVLGYIKTMADPRRWLDLVFEGLIALPLRLVTFTVAVTWGALVVGGLTFWIWGATIDKGQSLVQLIIEVAFGDAIPTSIAGSFWLDALFNLCVGIVALVTLPYVIRGMALLDSAVTRGALLAQENAPVSHRPVPGPARSPRIRSTGTATGRSMSAEGWAWIIAAFAAVALFAVTWPVLAVAYGWHVVVAMVLALMQSAAIVLVVRWAVVGAVFDVLTIAGTVTYAALGAPPVDFPLPWPVTLMIAHSLVVLMLALTRPWPWSVAVWFIGVIPSGMVLALFEEAGVPGHVMANIVVAASVSGGVAAIGIVARQLTQSRGALDTERRMSAEQSAKRQELEERNRIAQELHDVVAHSMSVIAVQSTTARYRIDDLDERAANEFSSIADSSRRALTEMRGLLSLLRTDADAPLAPQPTLADIDSLVETTRQSGAPIELRGADSAQLALAEIAKGVPEIVGLTAYRIVQESLSNAVRHAPGSTVEVMMWREADALRIRVHNGAALESIAGTPAPGSGMGLAGLRGRAAALGGSVVAGPQSDGYLLEATLPLS